MAKRKKSQPWDAVFDRVQPWRNPGWVRVPLATEVELTEVESQLGSGLPPSYRAFMKRFGSGELMGWVSLDSLSPRKGFSGYDLVKHTRNCRQFVEQSGDSFPNAAWFAQLVYFASSGGGDWYCWDPSARVAPEQCEYPCYCLRHENESRPIAVGNSFWEFLALVEDDVRSWRGYESESTAGIEFTPSTLRAKKKPLKRNTKLWLAFNNGTARDIALSIRDEGRADAFPILADALQDAGCGHADLLDACRTGDPDIDGKWVLQVLLGDK